MMWKKVVSGILCAAMLAFSVLTAFAAPAEIRGVSLQENGVVTAARVTVGEAEMTYARLIAAVYDADGNLLRVVSADDAVDLSQVSTDAFLESQFRDLTLAEGEQLRVFLWEDDTAFTMAPKAASYAMPYEWANVGSLTRFLFTEGGLAEETLDSGDKTSGYPQTSGLAANLSASIDGENGRKIEWSSDPYDVGTASIAVPVMAAGKKNPWVSGRSPYLQIALSTKGYTSLSFSAMLGATKKGPAHYQLQYSTDGTSFTDVPGGAFTLTSNKQLVQAFDRLALPGGADDADMLYLRIAVVGEETVGGALLRDNPTSGEVAINDIRIFGAEKPATDPTEPSTEASTEKPSSSDGTGDDPFPEVDTIERATDPTEPSTK